MEQKFTVLYNRSLESVFGPQARAVAGELDCPCFYTDEIYFKNDVEIDFQKCVFFDKDVIAGLRLEGLGIRLYNNIGSIELCDDKRRTNELLRLDGKIPETVPSPLLFADDQEFQKTFALKTAEKLGFPMIAKLAFGSLGQQVRLLHNMEDLVQCCEEWKGTPHLFQKYIASSHGKDVRIYVVAGQAVAAMERSNPTDFRSNIGSGGHGRKIIAPEGFEQVAIDACAALGLDFGGVDLLYGPHGEPLICEVNSNALFRELNQVCDVRVEKHIAAAVRNEDRNFSNFSL